MKKGEETQKIKLLTWAVVFAIVLTLINSYSIININSKVNLANIIEAQGGAVPNQQGQAAIEPTRKTISMDDDPVKGDLNAPVTIIEFSDFECPFCEKFYSETLDQYVNTQPISIFFTIFCFVFLQNILNMFDGINGSLSTYLLTVLFVLLFITFSLFKLCLFLIIISILYLNFNNKIFLGNNGSSIISSIMGVLLISIHNSNPEMILAIILKFSLDFYLLLLSVYLYDLYRKKFYLKKFPMFH